MGCDDLQGEGHMTDRRASPPTSELMFASDHVCGFDDVVLCFHLNV